MSEIHDVAENAQLAFWRVVADAYPEVKTGDFSPEATLEFDEACETAIERWLTYNRSRSLSPGRGLVATSDSDDFDYHIVRGDTGRYVVRDGLHCVAYDGAVFMDVNLPTIHYEYMTIEDLLKTWEVVG